MRSIWCRAAFACWSSNSATAAPASRRCARFTIATTISRSRNSSAPVPAGAFSCACRCVLKNSSGSSRMRLRIGGRTFAPRAIQLAGFPRIAVMLGEDRRHPLAILQALARHRHQKLHRYLRQDLALAHLLLDRFRQNLHQRQPPRYPTHAAVESARQLIEPVAEAPLQLRQQPAHFQRGLVFATVAASGPAAPPRPRSSATPPLPPCPGPVAPAPRSAYSRR